MDKDLFYAAVVSNQDFEVVIKDIVGVLAPAEVPLLKRRLSRLLALRKEALPRSSAEERIRSIGPLEVGVLSLHLITGTMALIEIYRTRAAKLDERERELELQREWEEALRTAGMDAELARQIPVKFSPGIIRFIAKQRFGSAASSDGTPGSTPKV